jgi:putative transposase
LARRLRFAPPGYWLHLTQRGNNRQKTFTSDADREFFLNLLDTHSAEREVRIAGYALMSNHFHLIAAGDRPDAISLFMMDVNGRYATYRNATQRTRGHIWQDRFFSCVLDDAHWATALRYVELNAVRARIVKQAEADRWSSARIHLGLESPPAWLDTEEFQRRWPTPLAWRESLNTLTRREVAAIRRATRHDAALGSDAFIENLERTFAVQLRPRPLGRPRKPPTGTTSATAGQALEILSA